jgi:hypothetical protein
MVTIIGFKTCVSQDGKVFNALILQSDLKFAISEKTGNSYFTTYKTSVSTSFTDEECKMLIGRNLQGEIKKAPCEEYEYVNKETGESFMLNWKYQYTKEEPALKPQTMNPYMGSPYSDNPYNGQQQHFQPFYNMQLPQQQLYHQNQNSNDFLANYGMVAEA